MNLRHFPILLGLVWVTACSGGSGDAPGASATASYDGIAAGETVHYTGTEPFWGGAAAGGMATYETPDNPGGSEFPVERFSGNNGIGFSGRLKGASFDMTITPGACSDGMSDRTYPYTATLMLGGEQRLGCAWTDSQPFSGPETP
ncbi:COG3650 family protein [Qipengyuania sp.]|uniref:COG3650 family protein n=1 Tax=Qipengyuania sp. TaxID=2004515 RepID=UPI003AF90ECC